MVFVRKVCLVSPYVDRDWGLEAYEQALVALLPLATYNKK